MASLETFFPPLSFFDKVYGASADQVPVSFDTEFFEASGEVAAQLSFRCLCEIGDGGWQQKPAASGAGWSQRPLADDVESIVVLE